MGRKYCAAYNCSNCQNEDAKKRGLSFHVFPKDKSLLNKWIRNIRRVKYKPTLSSRVCSKHFEPECFTQSGWSSKRFLVPGSEPTLFDFPPHLCTEKKHRKPPKDRTELPTKQNKHKGNDKFFEANEATTNKTTMSSAAIMHHDELPGSKPRVESEGTRILATETIWITANINTSTEELPSDPLVKDEIDGLSESLYAVGHEHQESSFSIAVEHVPRVNNEQHGSSHNLNAITTHPQDKNEVSCQINEHFTSQMCQRSTLETDEVNNASYDKHASLVCVDGSNQEAAALQSIMRHDKDAGYATTSSTVVRSGRMLVDVVSLNEGSTRMDIPSLYLQETSEMPKRIFKRKHELGDFKEDDMNCPTTAKKYYNISNRVLKEKKREIATLNKKNQQLQAKICNLKQLLDHFKEKTLATDLASTSLV